MGVGLAFAAEVCLHELYERIHLQQLSIRLEEVEVNAVAGSRRIINKLEARLRDIEVELDEERRKHAETIKILRKKERSVKEVYIQIEEDQKNIQILQDALEKANQKIAAYKRQLVEQVRISMTSNASAILTSFSLLYSLHLSLGTYRNKRHSRPSPRFAASSASSRPPKTVPMWLRAT